MSVNRNEREILMAAGRVPNLISRDKVLKRIGEAIFRNDKSTQIIALASGGGYGKTALLKKVREALAARNNINQNNIEMDLWGDQTLPVAFSEIFDFHNTRFNIRDDFFHQLSSGQNWNQPDPLGLASHTSLSNGLELNFPRSENSAIDYRRAMISGLGQVKQSLDEQRQFIEDTFWNEYADEQHAQKYRMVLFLDTVEIFDRISYRWIDKHILPRRNDLATYFDYSTKWFLLNAIKNNQFPNTTIILSGRKNEAPQFFKELKDAVNHSNLDSASLQTFFDEIELDPFRGEDIKQYISALIKQQEEFEIGIEVSKSHAEQFRWNKSDWFKKNLKNLLEDEEDIQKIRLLTGGQPIRLAMYISFLFDGHQMVNYITEPLEKLQQRVGIDDYEYDLQTGERTAALLELRNEIELDFIAQLSASRSLSTRILQLLIRTPRGLTVPQIHFLLDGKLIDSNNKAAMRDWFLQQQFSDQFRARLNEIRTEIEWMNTNLFYMVRFDPVNVLDSLDHKSFTKELVYGILDEFYRIFAWCLAPIDFSRQATFFDNGETHWKHWNRKDWTESEINSFSEEAKLRKEIYERVIAYNGIEWDDLQQVRTDLINIQIGSIEIKSVEDITRSRFEGNSLRNMQLLERVMERIRRLDIDYVHYLLLTDPYIHLNDEYADLGHTKDDAADRFEGEVMRIEAARTLYEDFAAVFITYDHPDPEPVDSQLGTVRRLLSQQETNSLILKLALKGRYQDAVNLINLIEEALNDSDIDMTNMEVEYWNAPVVLAERIMWHAYALGCLSQFNELIALVNKPIKIIYLPETTNSNASTLNDCSIIEALKLLVSSDDYKSNPFYSRAKFALAELNNRIGYAKTSLGMFADGKESYGNALTHIKADLYYKGELGNILNNLSRVLMELGRRRAVRICEDGLEIRIGLGHWVNIAYSYNTLGLIYNNFFEPNKAVNVCGKAYVIAESLNDIRLTSLVQIQLAVSLRRYINAYYDPEQENFNISAVWDEIEELLKGAEQNLNDLYDDKPTLRKIEAKNELGCYYRDKLHYLDPLEGNLWQRSYALSKRAFNEAITMAKDPRLNIQRLAIDNMVNKIWLEYHALKGFIKCKGAGNDADQQLEATEIELRKLAKNSILEITKSLQSQDKELPNIYLDKQPNEILEEVSRHNRCIGTDPKYRLNAFAYRQLAKIDHAVASMALLKYQLETKRLSQELKGDEYLQLSGAKRIKERKLINEEIATNPTVVKYLQEAVNNTVKALGYAEMFSERSSFHTIIYDYLYRVAKAMNEEELKVLYRLEDEAQRIYQTNAIQLPSENRKGNLQQFLKDSFGNF